MQACGLKHEIAYEKRGPDWVTPHAGVWIETETPEEIIEKLQASRLMQACGLKRTQANRSGAPVLSRLMQACGLKL